MIAPAMMMRVSVFMPPDAELDPPPPVAMLRSLKFVPCTSTVTLSKAMAPAALAKERRFFWKAPEVRDTCRDDWREGNVIPALLDAMM